MPDTRPEHLVVAFNFPPYNDGSAVTVAKRIVEEGRPVDVISADLSKVRSVDNSLSDLVSPWVKTNHRVSVPIIFADELSVLPFVDKGLRALGRRTHLPYRSVYSRSMWPHSHFLAAHARAKGLAIKWTAEFSDPILWHVDATPRPSGSITIDDNSAQILRAVGARAQQLLLERSTVLEWAQFVPFLLADELVFTNPQQREVMVRDAPEWLRDSIRARSTISSHPTLPANYYGSPSKAAPRSKNDKFTVGYFGNFYPNRGGGEFMEAVSSMPLDWHKHFKLDIYTGDAAPLLRVATRLGISKLVRVLPPLPLLEFLRASNQYDALLVNDIATSPFGLPSPFLPSKISDYTGSSAPVMSISLKGSPLDQHSARYRARTGDVDSIRTMLTEALSSWRNISSSKSPRADTSANDLATLDR